MTRWLQVAVDGVIVKFRNKTHGKYITNVFVVQDIVKLPGGGWGNKNRRPNEALGLL